MHGERHPSVRGPCHIVSVPVDRKMSAQIHSNVRLPAPAKGSELSNQSAYQNGLEDQQGTSTALEDWLTVDDVAAWLKVSKS